MQTEMDLSKLVYLPYSGQYKNTFDNKARIKIPLEIRKIMGQRYEFAELESGLQAVYFKPTTQGVEVYDNPILRYLSEMGQINFSDIFLAGLDSQNRINIGMGTAKKYGFLEQKVNITGKENYFFISK